MHLSVPKNNTVQIIEKTEISPLVDKCVIKVCYVGEQPNRNRTVITEDVAREMGRKLPGSPIVGFFNDTTNDFEGHNRDIKIGNGEFKIIDTTKPYGFVPTDATVWFETFNDEGVEHKYLCTEGILWTKAYEEASRILTQGNNQSMEINAETEKGFWTNELKTGDRIFIYNEALIEKLCILGENVEPCFEGAQIKEHFSLAADEFEKFKTSMFELINKLENAVQGGLKNPMDNENQVLTPEEDLESEVVIDPVEEPIDSAADPVEEPAADPVEDPVENPEEDAEAEQETEEDPTPAEDQEENPSPAYNLNDVVEYQELLNQYNELNEKFNNLNTELNDLQGKYAALVEFKADIEAKEKTALIESFYMLSEEDKKDVIEHQNEYSLEDIKAKLAIICFDKKVSFIKEGEERDDPSSPTTFSLNNTDISEDEAPAWIKAVRENQK